MTSIDEQYALITQNLAEILIDEPLIKGIMRERSVRIYWGTAPTGRIHIGYFIPILKIIDFINAGCTVIILIADLHAILDNLKSTPEQIEYRSQYYICMIKQMLLSLNVDVSKIIFTKGSDYQLSKEYTFDMYKLHTLITYNDAKHAGAEVVKQTDNPKMTCLLYPTLQALDEKYLQTDLELGGIDQRKIFMHARKILPIIGYKKGSYLMNDLIPGLCFSKSAVSEKMSASDNTTKLDILDTPSQIKKKINKAYCLEGDTADNCLITLLIKILFPILKLKQLPFVINRKDEYGGKIVYGDPRQRADQNTPVFGDDHTQVVLDFAEKKLHPGDLKLGVIDTINLIFDPIRNAFFDPVMQELIKNAYP